MHTQGAHELASFFFPHLHLTNCIHAVKSTDPEEGIHVSKAFLWTGKAEEIIRRGTMFSGIKQAGFKMQQIWSRNDDRTKCTVPKVTRAVGLSVVMWPFSLFPTQKCVNPWKKKKKKLPFFVHKCPRNRHMFAARLPKMEGCIYGAPGSAWTPQ